MLLAADYSQIELRMLAHYSGDPALVRAFAEERLAPHAARWDREHHFPRAELAALGGLGVLGVVVPEQWGGAGLDYVSLAVALEEIAAGDGSTSTRVAPFFT